MLKIKLNGNQITNDETTEIMPYSVFNRQGQRELHAWTERDAKGRPTRTEKIANVTQVWGSPGLEDVIAGHISEHLGEPVQEPKAEETENDSDPEEESHTEENAY